MKLTRLLILFNLRTTQSHIKLGYVFQGNKAIVVDEPGVTRDRLYGRSYWGDYEFMVIDTGGVLTISKSRDDVMEELAISTTIGMEGIPLASREAAVARMPSMIERQATVAVEEASVIIFLVDGQVWILMFLLYHTQLSYLSHYLVNSKVKHWFSSYVVNNNITNFIFMTKLV